MITASDPRQQPARDLVAKAIELVTAGLFLEAESLLIEAAEFPGIDVGTRCALARLALQIEKPHLARGLLDRALAAAPNSPDVRFLAGISDRMLGHLPEARENLIRAQPKQNPDAAYYLSVVEEALGNFSAAKASIDSALRIHPSDTDYLNQASCLAARLGDFTTAVTLSQKAHEIEPEAPGLAFNHAQNLLLVGRAPEAWPLFDARLAFISEHLLPRNGSAFWDGSPLEGKSLLVWHERGLGDTIQFSRYLPRVASTAGRVIFRCQPECADLLRPHLPGIEVLEADAPVPSTDFHLPLMSLPAQVGCSLASPPPSVLGGVQRPAPASRSQRIGFVLSGNPNHPDDSTRSIPLGEFLPLLQEVHDWICLQKNMRDGEKLPQGISHPAPKFRFIRKVMCKRVKRGALEK